MERLNDTNSPKIPDYYMDLANNDKYIAAHFREIYEYRPDSNYLWPTKTIYNYTPKWTDIENRQYRCNERKYAHYEYHDQDIIDLLVDNLKYRIHSQDPYSLSRLKFVSN